MGAKLYADSASRPQASRRRRRRVSDMPDDGGSVRRRLTAAGSLAPDRGSLAGDQLAANSPRPDAVAFVLHNGVAAGRVEHEGGRYRGQDRPSGHRASTRRNTALPARPPRRPGPEPLAAPRGRDTPRVGPCAVGRLDRGGDGDALREDPVLLSGKICVARARARERAFRSVEPHTTPRGSSAQPGGGCQGENRAKGRCGSTGRLRDVSRRLQRRKGVHGRGRSPRGSDADISRGTPR
jgi:hypothetical protein